MNNRIKKKRKKRVDGSYKKYRIALKGLNRVKESVLRVVKTQNIKFDFTSDCQRLDDELTRQWNDAMRFRYDHDPLEEE